MPDERPARKYRLLREREVLDWLSISRSTLARLRARGQFPQPRRLSTGVLVFDEEEIEKWIGSRPRVGHEAS